MSPSERKAMINRDRTDLSLTRQCKLLRISRSSLYYTPVGMDADTLKLMSEIDRVFTKYPFFHCPAGHCKAMSREGQPSDRRVSATQWVPCGSPSGTSPYAGHGAASHPLSGSALFNARKDTKAPTPVARQHMPHV